jgi:hypothetical protein
MVNPSVQNSGAEVGWAASIAEEEFDDGELKEDEFRHFYRRSFLPEVHTSARHPYGLLSFTSKGLPANVVAGGFLR